MRPAAVVVAVSTAVAVAVSLLNGSSRCGGEGPTSTSTPVEMFTSVILDPVPEGVEGIQGVGDTWQGYSLYLRFEATDEALDSILATGYREVFWSEISEEFDLPQGYDIFDPPWSPSSVINKDCYMDEVVNGWTHQGTHYLLDDRRTGTVHFRGLGA